MRQNFIDLTTSTSTSLSDKNDYNPDAHFRWDSIKKFLYLAHACSSSIFNFDIFSRVIHENMTLLEFIHSAVTIGMAYMFMDFFIKQYTRKLDTNETLNPLLRGVTFGILLQTAFWALINATSLADTLRFLAISIPPEPIWMFCHNGANRSCIPSEDIFLRCKAKNLTNIKTTSVHFYYDRLFVNFDRNSLSTRFFLIAIVWISNFFIASITDNALLKLFKLTFLWGTFSTLFIVISLLFSTYTTTAFYQIMDLTDPKKKYPSSMNRPNEMFSVGLIGVYDFGTMSPFTMIDSTVVIFAIVATAIAFARSLIMRVMYIALSSCVELQITVTPHYLMFVMVPLSVEFMDIHKIYILYVYTSLTVALVPGLAMMTLTISKLVHNEFRSVKYIYIIGILCFFGFTLSLPLTVACQSVFTFSHVEQFLSSNAKLSLPFNKSKVINNSVICEKFIGWASALRSSIPHVATLHSTTLGNLEYGKLVLYSSCSDIYYPCLCISCSKIPTSKLKGLIIGHKLSSFYLGGFKVLIVMWVYGVKKFSADIQFWLGFKPTIYWRTVWMLLPIVFFILIVNKINEVILLSDVQQQISAIIWVSFSLITVAIFQIKTVARYILHNNLMGIFRDSPKYGPLDPDDRRRRKRFDETALYHQCKHDCIVLSEKFECNHLPLIFKNKSPTSESTVSSVTNIYDATETRKRMSSVVDLTGSYN